ncbi:gamma-glutamylcyclotransferase [Gordonia sp. TBRC 11910]|uniref:Gamma-glutamylcyclotransferase n=1 Tax=Gordonia asplenii TaxID=2725283 RepID=A0A848L0F0_9ACTN|nr:gamma-glutamylcyclotransferase family protein [Gordonia asplenii]NMO01168.1 gamma-glutamylcyclotransferase [Gordonia asplenii]
MHHLFSYGTLQLPDVQAATFGRRLTGRPDAIVGFRSELLTITDPLVIERSGSERHPILVRGNSSDVIEGTTFTIDDTDLVAADEYEVDDYTRIEVPLRSGGVGWVYVFAGEHGSVRDQPTS